MQSANVCATCTSAGRRLTFKMRQLIDVKVVVVCSVLSHAHFAAEVLVKRSTFVAPRSRRGAHLPLPRWDGGRLGQLEVLEHVLSDFLLFITERVQRGEGSVFHFVSRGGLGRRARGALLVRERARKERIVPSTSWTGGGRMGEDMGWRQRWGAHLRGHLVTPGIWRDGKTAISGLLREAICWTWDHRSRHGEHGGHSSRGPPYSCSGDVCRRRRSQMKIPLKK